MATTSNVRSTILGIVNEVERKMAYTPSANLSARRTTQMYRDFLNDIVSDVSDYGDWPQLYEEVLVTAQTSVHSVEVNASAPVKNIYEVHFGSQIMPLYPVDVQQIRLLQRTSAVGPPRQFSLSKTSGINPMTEVYPTPGSSQAGSVFNYAVYSKPRTYTTADASVTPPFSSRLLVQGVYAKALLDENGGAPTPQYQVAQTEFNRMLREEWNRTGADTGTDIYIVPGGEGVLVQN